MSCRSCTNAAMWSTWFIRRFPARESRWRICSPEEASIGAVPVQDAKWLRSANRAHVADVGQDPGGDDGSDPVQVHQVRPRCQDHLASARPVSALMRASTGPGRRAARRRAAARVFPTTSRGRTVASIVLACGADCPVLVPPGISSVSSRCSRFRPSGPGTGTARRAGRRAAAAPQLLVEASSRSPSRSRTATIATECASSASVLRSCPVSNTRTRADSLAGTSSTVSPSASSRCASGRPDPVAPSTAHDRVGHCRQYRASPVAGRGRWRTGRSPEHLLVCVDAPRSWPTACGDPPR